MAATRTKKNRTDVSLHDHGSVIMVEPKSAEARAWVEQHVQLEPWQWLGGGFACEPRYLPQLVEGMREEGLSVR